MKIFGMEVVTDSSSPRYNVWEIEKLAYYSLILGVVNIIVLFIFSFDTMIYLFTLLISGAVFYVIRLKFKESSKGHIAEVLMKINNNELFKYEVPDEVIDDCTKDDEMNILTGKIETQLSNIFIDIIILSVIVFLLVIFVNLPINFLNIIFLNFWVYLSIFLTEEAVKASKNDFKNSLRSGTERMYAMDTIRRG